MNITVHTENDRPLVFEAPNGGTFNVNLFFSGYPVKNHYDVIVRMSEETLQTKRPGVSRAAICSNEKSKPTLTSAEEVAMNARCRSDRAEAASIGSYKRTMLSAIVACLMKADPESWEFQVNVLNLKNATIKEIGSKVLYYSKKLCITENQLMDILTHWTAAEQDVDIEACFAIANVLKKDILVIEKDASHLFKGKDNDSRRIITVTHSEGTFHLKKDERDTAIEGNFTDRLNENERYLY